MANKIIIGTTMGQKVFFNKRDAVVTVYGTNIMMVTAGGVDDAVERCKKFLKDFKVNK